MRALSRGGSVICIGSLAKRLQKTYHFCFVRRGDPGSMVLPDRRTRQLRCCRAFFWRIILLTVSIVTFPAALCAQISIPASGAPASAVGGALQVQTSPVQTSAQNPVFGSVPDAKPT